MDCFTNPYNFVPLEGKCVRSSLSLGKEDNLTGYFTCTMELLTPLFVPNTSCSQALCSSEERKQEFSGYEFCSYEDLSEGTERDAGGYTMPPKAPVICGSEIRGVIRSVHEAAFRGCMSTTVVDGVLGRRHPRNKKPGILRKNSSGGYEIVPCKRVVLHDDKIKSGKYTMVVEYDSLKEGQKIWIKLWENDDKSNGKFLKVKVVEDYKIPEGEERKTDDYIEGWLHKGDSFSKKIDVFYEAGEPAKIVTEDEIEFLRTVLKEYQDLSKKTKFPKSNYPKLNLDSNQILLIYYCDDKDVPMYIAPACIGEELYPKTLGTILKSNGGYQPCDNRGELCPTCRLFGMVSKKDGGKAAVGSRVRFTDATLINPKDTDNLDTCYMKPLILPESGKPHPGTVEFYTLSPYTDAEKKEWNTEGYWTYGYKCVKGKGKVIRKGLPDHLPRVRGRKFYWHNDKLKFYSDKNKLEHVMQHRIRPINASNPVTGERQFCFRVYFNKISQEELGRLRWSLDFSDSGCAHKLGRGKAFGFGSIKIHIDDLKIQKLHPETGALELISKDYKEFGIKINESGEAIKILKLMSNWQKRPKDVSYPVVVAQNSEGESYRWFVNNRKGANFKEGQPEFSEILPKAVEELGKKRNQKKRWNKGYW